MIRSFFISIVFLLGTVCCPAQTAAEILDKANAAFTTYENLSMEVTAYSYATAGSAASLIGKGKMCKSKSGYYSRFLDDEMISNTNCTVIINHELKTVHCFTEENSRRRKNNYLPETDSLRAQSDSLVYKGVVNGMQLIVAYSSGSFVEKTEIYISPSTSLLSRIVYYYAPANEDFSADAWKTEVIYDRISFDKPDESFFSEKKFVERKDKTWVLASAYHNYHLTIVTPPKS